MNAFRAVFPAILPFLLSAAAVRADDREKALAVLDRAIQAHGGEGRLADLKVIKRADKGKILFLNKEIPVKGELTVQLPDKARVESELEQAPGQKSAVTLVVNGERGWRSLGGMSSEMSNEEAA